MFHSDHVHRETRVLSELVVYACWMALSRRTPLSRKILLFREIQTYMSDTIINADPSIFNKAHQVCKYLSEHSMKRKRLS